MGWLSSLVGGIVGFAIGGPMGAAIGAGLGATKVGEKIVNSVLDFVTQPFMPNMPDTGVDSGQREQGVMIQRTGSVNQIPVVYGYRKVAGTVAFAETGSSNNKYLYVAYVFAEGVVEGLREVYINDWLLPVDQIGNLNAGQLVTINADKYKDRVQLRWYPGNYFANPSTSPVGVTVKNDIFADAPSFNSQMTYNGLAVLFARFEWKEIKTQADADANPFTGSIPEIKIGLLGKRVASLLTENTEVTPYDSNTVRYSTNPAECLLDYLRNSRYGKGLINDDIDWDTWKKAARKCNQTVTYTTSGITGPILTLNMVLDTNQTIMSNTKSILQNFRGYMPYVQGKYKLRIEDAGNETDITSGVATIVQTFTKDDIVSDITFNGIEKSAKYNVVSVTYVDPDQKFEPQSVVYPETEAERQVYIDLDGGRENKYDVTLGGITNYAIAKDFARLMFNKQRRQESCIFTATSRALELEPGDSIRIQSNILNFGTDPWRVISIKINNDMTVDLGCVRNPDDIYPHTRVGEEDIVLPVYVPKGSFIYYPSADYRVPLGLVPPTFAVFPPDATPNEASPPATDPNAPEGGGVGGGPNGGPTGSTTIPVGPGNNAAVAPPKPPAFDSVLGLRTSTLTDHGNGTYSFNVFFTQPSLALYDYSIVWIRPNKFSPWQQYRLDNKPGVGLDIPWTYGPQAEGIFEVYARSYATDGRASTQVLFIQLSSRGDARALGRTVTSTSVKVVAEGWTVPAAQAAPIPKYDDDIDFLEIRPRLTTGAPQDPRRLDLTIQQLGNLLTKPVNTLITGFRVYYKLSSASYWSYEDHKWPANYIPGQKITYNLAGDFGIRYYPNSWTNVQPGGATNLAQQYDFMVMLTYADGKPAVKYLPPQKGLVEYSAGVYDFKVYGTAGNTLYSKPIEGFTWATVDQNPNKVTATGVDTIPGIATINNFNSGSKLTFNFNLPKTTGGVYFGNFISYKIRYRKIVPGLNPQFSEVDSGRATITDIVSRSITDFSYGEKYQFVITGVFRVNGVDVETTNSLVSDGVTINYTDYNTTLDVYTKFTFVQRDTKEALGQLKTAFAALPTINAKAWIKKQLLPLTSSTNAEVIDRRLNRYYKLIFQPTPGADTLVVYRRFWSPTGAARTTASGFAKYYGLGPWEKVVITLSSLTTNADGFKEVYLRGPIGKKTMSDYYQVPSYSQPLINPFYGSTGALLGAPGLTDFFPYEGTVDGDTLSDPGSRNEFLIVMRTAGVEQTKGLLLTSFFAANTGTNYKQEVDGFTAGVSRDLVVNVSDYNTLDSGYRRNLNQAFTNASGGNIVLSKLVPNSAGIAPQNGVLLAAPSNGDTVY